MRLRQRPRQGTRRSLLLLCAFVWACTQTPSDPVAEPEPPPNFVFVLIDTLRADHVGAYGYERGTTPFIDSLAAEGLRFEHAVAQAPWTGASMASIWTSRYPTEVGAGVLPDESGQRLLGKTGSTRLRPEVPTLAEVLSRAGHRTIAIVSNAYAGGVFGLLRGFDVSKQAFKNAERVTTAAIAELEALAGTDASTPFFLYVHYIDVHEPTFPPPAFRAKFRATDGQPHTRAHAGWKFGRDRDPNDPEFQAFREHKLALYDASIRFVDAQVERLAKYLDESGLRDSTVFVVASDHGEEFWDHAEFERDVHLDPRGVSGIGHGQSLFGELTDVPLILQGPGVPKGTVSSLVRNLDVAPTILGLAGIESAPLGLRGVDLVSATASGTIPLLEAFSESISYGVEAKSIATDEWKLIRYSNTKTEQREFLFDLRADPTEQRDRSGDAPEELSRRRGALESTLGRIKAVRGTETEIDAKTRANLKALGYIAPDDEP